MRGSVMERIMAKVEKRGGHWIWRGAISGRTTPMVRLGPPEKHRRVNPRAVLCGTLDRLDSREFLAPVCGESKCVRPSHMKVMTFSEFNSKPSPLRACTPTQVREIRRLCTPSSPGKRDAKITLAEMAERMGVSPRAIHNIVHRKTYKDVE